MTPNEYQQLATTTESTHLPLEESVSKNRLLHAAMGCCTETGELQDALKREFFYGKPADSVNLIEEFGDVLWYVAVGLSALGCSMEDCMRANIQKLKIRFPERFSDKKAINRDIIAERAALEESHVEPRQEKS